MTQEIIPIIPFHGQDGIRVVAVEFRTCSRCGMEKPIRSFNCGAHGRTHTCHKCKSDRCKSGNPIRFAAKNKRKRQKYEKANPVKIAAQKELNQAVAGGLVEKKPCEVCHKEGAEAHHDDYSKPLDVRWLCSEHHSEWHRINGRAING